MFHIFVKTLMVSSRSEIVVILNETVHISVGNFNYMMKMITYNKFLLISSHPVHSGEPMCSFKMSLISLIIGLKLQVAGYSRSSPSRSSLLHIRLIVVAKWCYVLLTDFQ